MYANSKYLVPIFLNLTSTFKVHIFNLFDGLNSLLKINYENASSETLYKVYGNFPFEMDYGENAFTLANYLNQHLEKPVIRKQTYRSEN